MFVNFFITFHDVNRSGSIGSASGMGTPANPHSTFRKPLEISTSFYSIVHNLSSKFGCNNVFISNTNDCTRIIPVNIPDEITFQLELLGVTEYNYCTYNLESKEVGFGNTAQRASNASMTGDASSGWSTNGFYYAPNNPSSQEFFDFSHPTNDSDVFEFKVPEAFRQDIIDELIPYIKYEKAFMFNESVFKLCEFELSSNESSIMSYLSTYFVPHNSRNFIHKTAVSVDHIKKCFDFYRYDDEDVYATKEYNYNNFEFMRQLCVKIMQLTNETF
jgi:hypothetical protein